MSDICRPEAQASPEPSTPAAQQPAIVPVLLLLANLLKRSGNLTYNAELGLSSIAWTMIARLGDDGPMTQSEMSENWLMDKGQVSRTAVELEQDGLILRESRTWRSIELRLTPKGRKIFAAIGALSRARHEALVKGIGARDLQVLYETLGKINANAVELLDRLKAADRSGA